MNRLAGIPRSDFLESILKAYYIFQKKQAPWAPIHMYFYAETAGKIFDKWIERRYILSLIKPCICMKIIEKCVV